MNNENNKLDFYVDTTSIFSNNYPLSSTIISVDSYASIEIDELKKTISQYREIILRRCPEELI